MLLQCCLHQHHLASRLANVVLLTHSYQNGHHLRVLRTKILSLPRQYKEAIWQEIDSHPPGLIAEDGALFSLVIAKSRSWRPDRRSIPVIPALGCVEIPAPRFLVTALVIELCNLDSFPIKIGNVSGRALVGAAGLAFGLLYCGN